MSHKSKNLVGKVYGPFKVIKDERKHFYGPVTVQTRCCGRIIKKKTVITLNTVRWRGGEQCAQCAQKTWSGFTGPQHALLQRARAHGLVRQWQGKAGAKRLIEHIGKRPSEKHILGTKNPSKPHSPSNTMWMTASENLVSHNLAVAVPTRYGVSTIPRVAEKLHLSRQAIHQRRERGYTLEEATTRAKGVVPRRLHKLRANKRKRKK